MNEINKRLYVLEITTTSQGTEERHFTPYDNTETAYRKFYEPLTKIGAGPKKIVVGLYDSDLNQIKRESWEKPEELEVVEPVTPEDEPTEPEDEPSKE